MPACDTGSCSCAWQGWCWCWRPTWRRWRGRGQALGGGLMLWACPTSCMVVVASAALIGAQACGPAGPAVGSMGLQAHASSRAAGGQRTTGAGMVQAAVGHTVPCNPYASGMAGQQRGAEMPPVPLALPVLGPPAPGQPCLKTGRSSTCGACGLPLLLLGSHRLVQRPWAPAGRCAAIGWHWHGRMRWHALGWGQHGRSLLALAAHCSAHVLLALTSGCTAHAAHGSVRSSSWLVPQCAAGVG